MTAIADIIDIFGGPPAMAKAINLVSAELRPRGRLATAEMIYNWRVRRRINQDWYPSILSAAESGRICLTADQLVAVIAKANQETAA